MADVDPIYAHSLEQVDETFYQKMAKVLTDSLAKVSASPFPVDTKAIPVNVSSAVNLAVLKDKVLAIAPQLEGIFSGVGVPYEYDKDLTGEANFEFLDLFSKGGTFVACFRVHEYERTGNESYTAVDLVVYLDQAGDLQAEPIVKKAIIGGGAMVEGGLKGATFNRKMALEGLRAFGIPVIHLHGVDIDTAVLYESLYPAGTAQILEDMKKDAALAYRLMPQLWHIARRLDAAGYPSQNFLSDLVFDGENFLYLDGGADVGWQGGALGEHPSQDLLLRTFPLYTPVDQGSGASNDVKNFQEEVTGGVVKAVKGIA
jgi:hypothetical protein